jgi:hypothetical protein
MKQNELFGNEKRKKRICGHTQGGLFIGIRPTNIEYKRKSKIRL